MGRRILHVDFNSFYASVACFLDPALGRSVYGEYSTRVEAFGLHENWIDVTG